MEVITYPNASAFLSENQAFIEQEETVNSLLLGLSIGLSKQQETEGSRFFSVQQTGDIQMVAINTPGRYLILTNPFLPEAIPTLIDHLIEKGIHYPGCIGPEGASLTFAYHWMEKRRGSYEYEMKNLCYELREVIWPPKPAGQMRLGLEKDIPLLTQWFNNFVKEAMEQSESMEVSRSIVEKKIADQLIYVWEVEGIICCMAAKARPTANGVSINYVYTPKEQRKRGYAAQLVAHLSQLILEDGYTFCTLFADAEFPSSNRIYQKIGYREKGKFYNIRFLPK